MKYLYALFPAFTQAAVCFSTPGLYMHSEYFLVNYVFTKRMYMLNKVFPSSYYLFMNAIMDSSIFRKAE